MGALILSDGFDKYGPAGNQNLASVLIGDWLSTTGTISIVAGLSTTGYAIQLVNGSNLSATVTSAAFPASLNRIAGSFRINGPTSTASLLSGGIQINNNATACFTLIWSYSLARFELHTGLSGGTLLASGGSPVVGSTHVLSFDITLGASAAYAVYLDGVLLFSGTGNTGNGQSTCNKAVLIGVATVSTPTAATIIDDLCLFDPAHADYNSAVLTSNAVVETQFGSSDSQTQFVNDSNVVPVAGVATQGVFRGTATALSTTAGSIYLLKITPAVNCTINSISAIPNATNVAPKYKGVIYADSAGTPGALLNTGTEVTGVTAGAVLTLPLSVSQSLTGGTSYWIGFINDTAIAFQQYDATTGLAIRKANTYASGPPSPAGAGFTTGVATLLVWANCTGSAVNWPSVGLNPPLGTAQSQIHSANVGDEDLYNFPALVTNPTTIFGLGVKGFVLKSDAGARTASFNTKSGASDSTGSAPGQGLATTPQWQGSYFDKDPGTGSAWAQSGANAAKAGVSVAS